MINKDMKLVGKIGYLFAYNVMSAHGWNRDDVDFEVGKPGKTLDDGRILKRILDKGKPIWFIEDYNDKKKNIIVADCALNVISSLMGATKAFSNETDDDAVDDYIIDDEDIIDKEPTGTIYINYIGSELAYKICDEYDLDRKMFVIGTRIHLVGNTFLTKRKNEKYPQSVSGRWALESDTQEGILLDSIM